MQDQLLEVPTWSARSDR